MHQLKPVRLFCVAVAVPLVWGLYYLVWTNMSNENLPIMWKYKFSECLAVALLVGVFSGYWWRLLQVYEAWTLAIVVGVAYAFVAAYYVLQNSNT